MMDGKSMVSFENCRFDDVGLEPLKMLMPIEGYDDMPLVSLEEAVEPLTSLVSDVRRKAWCALEKVKECSLSDGLSLDEAAAIRLYTMEWKPKNKCLYFALNTVLRWDKPDRHEMLEPYFLYLKLFLSGLSRLPSERRFIYRGVKSNLGNLYANKKEIIWWGFSSCTASLNVLKSSAFLGTEGPRTMFTIDSVSGKNIRGYSEYDIEDEILLFAATRFEVVSYLEAGNDLHMIQLKEIQSPFPLLEPVTVSEVSKPVSNSDSIDKYPPTKFEDADDIHFEISCIIWLDAYKTDEEIRDTEQKLSSINNHLKRFRDVKQCQTYIEQQSQNDRLVMIVSGQLGRLIVPNINKLPQIISIYVYCMDKKTNEEWASKFKKVKAVVVQSNELIYRIKSDHKIQKMVEKPPSRSDSPASVRTADQQIAVPYPHSTLTCKGRHCTNCGRCRDWCYTGRPEDWLWIKHFRNWNHETAERWRNGNYYDKFKLHAGAKCNRSIYYSASYIVRFFSFGTFDGSHLIGHLCVCD